MPNIETSHREKSGNQFESIFVAAVAIFTFTIHVVRCQKYIIVFVLPQNINEWKRRSLIGLFKEVKAVLLKLLIRMQYPQIFSAWGRNDMLRQEKRRHE